MWPSSGPPKPSSANGSSSTGLMMNSTALVTSGSDTGAGDVSMAVMPDNQPPTPDLSAVKKTPVRGETAAGLPPRVYKTPLSGGGNNRNFLLRKAATLGASSGSSGSLPGAPKTPNSGPRVNPFDSQISHDTLHLPTFSPSVFSTVLSPSQESVSSTSS